jgi:hypothetical protein
MSGAPNGYFGIAILSVLVLIFEPSLHNPISAITALTVAGVMTYLGIRAEWLP